MKKADLSIIVLAAGEGKRLKSEKSKILHEIAGIPMIVRTLNILKQANPNQIVIVANKKNYPEIKKIASTNYEVVLQKEAKGTADATISGLGKVDSNTNTVAVFYGDDTAFYKPQTINRVYKLHNKTNATVTFITVFKQNPKGLGRIVRKNGKIVGIVEEKDAAENQLTIKEINDGVYFFKKSWLLKNIRKLKPSTVTGELYITDLVGLALTGNQKVVTFKLRDQSQWHGINTQDELEIANQKIKKQIHIMGAAGAGASAIASIAYGFGFSVTACDLNPNSSYWHNKNIKIQKGHSPNHLTDETTLIISPSILKLDPKNREIASARKNNLPVLNWQEFQGDVLQKDKFVISVAGGYGKSTTTAMISQILEDANQDPTCEIGATILDWRKNFRVGKSKYYVNEADEYADNFLSYNPDIAIILNIAWDHPDYFNNKGKLYKSYLKFINNIKQNGRLIVSSDKNLEKLLPKVRKDIRVVKVEDFKIKKLSVIGNFRKINANAALTAAKILKIDIDKAKETIQNFKGVARRLEYKGIINGAKVYDDYAVQPYTIKTTANALSKKFNNKKIVLILEPHTFSRINKFFNDFVSSLKKTNVDSIFITDIFGAREGGDAKRLSQKLASAIGEKALYTGSVENTAKYIKKNYLGIFNIILSMGAGDIYKLYGFLKKTYNKDGP